VILLDTNVISELIRPEPDQKVVGWIDGQLAREVGTTAVCLAELLHGVSRLDEGARKARLTTGVGVFAERLAGRILPFDELAAAHYAAIVTHRDRIGRPISRADAQIAAIARASRATLATRNVRDFADTGIALINPWS
jgi:toxin FitB